MHVYIHTQYVHTYIHTHTQTHTHIKIAEAYRTVSNEGLCILTGLSPIAIKIEEAAQFYQLTRGNRKEEAQIDIDMGLNHWQHPAQTITRILEDNDERRPIQIFTDGSKT